MGKQGNHVLLTLAPCRVRWTRYLDRTKAELSESGESWGGPSNWTDSCVGVSLATASSPFRSGLGPRRRSRTLIDLHACNVSH